MCEASTSDIYKLRLFFISIGAAFTWFISLPPNSVHIWADLEQKFHNYFFIGETELKLSHLTSVKQKYMKVFLSILEDLEILETDAIVWQFLIEIWLI